MARISCDVYHCYYNCEGGCRLGSIRVDGANASTSRETVCDSYTDKNEKGCVNCTPSNCACNNCEIECEAEDCKYNENCFCTADRIDVGGADACCCKDTECRTFVKE